MKYTKQQKFMIDAGMTLCFECQRGYNGDKSCGSMGMTKTSRKSNSACFIGRKIDGDNENNENN